MASAVPELAPKLRETLEAFKAAGVTLSAAEIVWLADLRRPCDSPADGSVPWVMGAPLAYAGVRWYPLHRLAESWWLRANDLMDGSQTDQIAAYLYAHAHSAVGDTSLRDCMSEEAIRDRVRNWFDMLGIHGGQIDALCDRLRVLDGEENSVPDPDENGVSEATSGGNSSAAFLAVMCKAFPGIAPEYWMTGCSAAEARAMLDGVSDDDSGFAKSERRTNAIRNYLKAVKTLWGIHRG